MPKHEYAQKYCSADMFNVVSCAFLQMMNSMGGDDLHDSDGAEEEVCFFLIHILPFYVLCILYTETGVLFGEIVIKCNLPGKAVYEKLLLVLLCFAA